MNKISRWDGLPIVIFGASGISREVAFLIEDINDNSVSPIFNFIGFVESNRDSVGKKIGEYAVVTCDEEFEVFSSRFPVLGVVLPIGFPSIKKKIFDNVLHKIDNLVFPNLIHPSVSLKTNTVKFGFGNIVTAGVRMTTDIEIGNFNLFNLNTTIGHDVKIGDYCVLNPLASISGGVILEDEILIGTGANILQNIKIGKQSIVGAGAVVTKDVDPNSTVVGIPAKPLRREKP